jgi:hypothetical protein
MAMGKVLMDTLFHETFDSSKYSDRFIEKVNNAVAIKLANPSATINEVAAPVQNTGMADALRASLLSMGVPADQIDAMVAKAGVDVPAAAPVATPAPAPAAPAFALTAPEAKAKPARKPRARKAS